MNIKPLLFKGYVFRVCVIYMCVSGKYILNTAAA